MKRLPHLTAVLAAFLLSLGATAQDFPIPYNPDDDANGLIGTPDLLSLLALFGEEFSAAVVAEDNESAIMYMGDMAYPLCAQSCKNLPGMWEMPTIEDLGLVWSEVNSSCCYATTWLVRPASAGNGADPLWYFESDAGNTLNPSYHRVQKTASPAGNRRCYCSIKEIPKVEYAACFNANNTSAWFECCQEKVAQGWIPLATNPYTYSDGSSSGQAFWRWAE